MPNSLAAFALVAHEFERTGDAVLGLNPLFAPIIAERSGQLFEPAWFGSRFTALYGYHMGPVIAQALIDRLVQSKLLRTERVGAGIVHRCSEDITTTGGFGEDRVLRLTESFVNRATQILQPLNKLIPAAQLQQAFLDRIARPEFTSIFLVPERAKLPARILTLRSSTPKFQEWSLEQAIDFLTADFVLHLNESSPEAFADLAAIAFGALVADAVSALAIPGQGSRPAGDDALRVVIDGPLLLDALNVNSPEHYDYAIGLLGLFKNAGLRLATFDHILAEMETLIRRTLEHFQAGDAYGPLAAQLRVNDSHRLFATYIANTLEEEVRNLGVAVLRSKIYEEARFANFFPEDREDSLRNALGDVHHQLERRLVDAKSIATVVRLKNERRAPSSVLESGTIFVTRNSVLARKVNSFLASGRSEPEPRYTCLTDGQLAGLLWFIGGSTSIHLSRMRLIANCASAVTPRKDVIAQMSDTLERLNPKHREQFVLLMQDRRASLCPMRHTAGFATGVSDAVAENTLDEMRAVVAEPLVTEARVAAAKEIELLRVEAERNRAIAEEQERRARGLEESMAALEVQSTATKSEADLKTAGLEFAAELATEQARRAEENFNRQRALGIRAVAARRKRIEDRRLKYISVAKWALRVIFLAVLLLSLAQGTRDHPIVVGLMAVYAIAGLWLFTPYFERVLEKVSERLVRSRFEQLREMANDLGLSSDDIASAVGVANEGPSSPGS
jgi:hypothetical protein